MLLAGPQTAGSMARRKDERLDARGLLVDGISDGLHGTPRLSEDVNPVKVEMLTDGDKFVNPGNSFFRRLFADVNQFAD